MATIEKLMMVEEVDDYGNDFGLAFTRGFIVIYTSGLICTFEEESGSVERGSDS